MGRAARAKRSREIRIKLPEGEFFKLVAKFRTVEVLRLEAQSKAVRLANEIVAKEIAAASAEGSALYEALAKKHGFDPKLLYRFDEATCELVAEATQK